ncbi:MAG TPA: RluA family pseudouridine synthase [Planktothrix sp.]|jgi:23S rRNA pseudouridine1911/1915/1917 synthase
MSEFDDQSDDDGSLIEICVERQTQPQPRLDQYLTQRLPELSRSRVQRLIEEGFISIDEKPAKAGLKLKGDERITIVLPPVEALSVEAEPIDLDIVFQDDDLAVINKPIGMVTHPGAGVSSGTLVNALMFHMKDSLSGISGVARPGIVHRLDKDTSGLLVIAKNDRAHRHLAREIRDKEAKRIYLALVERVMKEDRGIVDKPIGRHPVKRKQMAIIESGRRAVSHFEVLKRFGRYTLVKVELETGRTHQIRVHMASLGHPVVGDLVYNSKETGNEAMRRKLGLKGQALHAYQLSFTHPSTGRLLEFEAPLPPEFSALIDSLK